MVYISNSRSPAPSHPPPPIPPIREDSLPVGHHSAADIPTISTTSTTSTPVPVPVLTPTPTPTVEESPEESHPLVIATPGPTYTQVVLERGADGLGFSIVGGRGNPHGDLPIFVKTVFERGAAAECGLLRPGDQIHAVDHVFLEGKTHQEAVALLKNAKGTVTLTIVS